MKLWVDDVRTAPEGWVWAKTYGDAVVQILLAQPNRLIEISLDHDLGEEKTGYDLLTWIENEIHECHMRIPTIRIHSANPVGRRKMGQALDSIMRMKIISS